MPTFAGRLAGHRILLPVVMFLAGAAFPLSFAPFHIWPLAIACIMVLLFGVQRGRHPFLLFYCFYAGAYFTGASWIYVSIHEYGGATPLLAGALVVLTVLGWSLSAIPHAWLYVLSRRSLAHPLVVFAPLWVLSELFRSWFATGFPWLFVGYAHLDSPLVGYAPVLGVYGVSFVSVVTSVLLYVAAVHHRMPAVMLVVVIWAGGYGLGQFSFVERDRDLAVAAVQGNVDQHKKWRRDQVMPIYRQYSAMTDDHWDAELIVWPEAALTFYREQGGALLEALDERAAANNTTLVLGIPDRGEDGSFRNTTIALGAGSGSYQKRHLVPFGEYVPFEDWLRGLIELFDLPMSRNRPGPYSQAPMTAGSLVLSMSICYEIVFPELVRSSAVEPDILLTVSNDTWFGRSIGPDQHLQMALMRTVEHGRSMVRATNNGITVLANHRGEIIAQLPLDQAGVLRGAVPLLKGTTPYASYGNLPILALCLLSLVFALIWMHRENKKR